MTIGLLVIAMAVGGQAPASTPPGAPAEVPMLEVVVKREGPRGSGWAGDNGEKRFESFIIVSDGDTGCGLGAYNQLPSSFSGTAWRVTGETASRNGDTVTGTVTWQRVGENGKLVPNRHAELSQQLTLKVGQRFSLEPVASRSQQCGQASLEAGVVMRRVRPSPSAGADVAFMMESVAELQRLAGFGPVVDVELWLVDKRADGSEHAVRQVVPAGGGPNSGAFRFTSIVPGTDRGSVTVEITGNVYSVRGPTPHILRVWVDRRVTSAATGGAAGASMVQVALASPSDVVAIELPERGRAGVRTIVPGHDFSLRLRLAPGK